MKITKKTDEIFEVEHAKRACLSRDFISRILDLNQEESIEVMVCFDNHSIFPAFQKYLLERFDPKLIKAKKVSSPLNYAITNLTRSEIYSVVNDFPEVNSIREYQIRNN